MQGPLLMSATLGHPRANAYLSRVKIGPCLMFALSEMIPRSPLASLCLPSCQDRSSCGDVRGHALRKPRDDPDKSQSLREPAIPNQSMGEAVTLG